jgi:hypothetical protein
MKHSGSGQVKAPRGRSRPEPLAHIRDSEIVPILKAAPASAPLRRGVRASSRGRSAQSSKVRFISGAPRRYIIIVQVDAPEWPARGKQGGTTTGRRRAVLKELQYGRGPAPLLIRRPAKMGSFRYFVLQVPATKGACDRAARGTILAFLLLS